MKHFIDRPIEIKRIQEVLLDRIRPNRCSTFVLRGMGGIGKTQIAAEFMRCHQDDFDSIFWMNGASRESLQASFVTAATRIFRNTVTEILNTNSSTSKQDLNVIVRKVLDWLAISGNEKWLLIFDNYNQEDGVSTTDSVAYDIEQYIPNSNRGSILVTTRLARIEQLGESLDVSRLAEEGAQQMLQSWCGTRFSELIAIILFRRTTTDHGG